MTIVMVTMMVALTPGVQQRAWRGLGGASPRKAAAAASPPGPPPHPSPPPPPSPSGRHIGPQHPVDIVGATVREILPALGLYIATVWWIHRPTESPGGVVKCGSMMVLAQVALCCPPCFWASPGTAALMMEAGMPVLPRPAQAPAPPPRLSVAPSSCVCRRPAGGQNARGNLNIV
jgi:hypothetical protein